MQKLRPYVLPGLFVFHVLFLVVIVASSATASEASPPFQSVWFYTVLMTLASQLCLTALGAAWGSEPWPLRLPGWGALAALSWFALVLVCGEDWTARSPARLLHDNRDVVVRWGALGSWFLLVGLLLGLRMMPFLRWQIVPGNAPSVPVGSPVRATSLRRSILLVLGVWCGVLVLLSNVDRWVGLGADAEAEYGAGMHSSLLVGAVQSLIFTVAFSLLVTLPLCIGLIWNRLADWLLYRRPWTLPVLANLVTCAAIALLLSFGGPFDNVSQRLLASLGLLPALASQPLTALVLLGYAGYRLKRRRKDSQDTATTSGSTGDLADTPAPVAGPWANLRQTHLAALGALLLVSAAAVPTGILDNHKFHMYCFKGYRYDDEGNIVWLRFKNFTTDEVLRPFSDATRLQSHSELQTLGLHDTQITNAGLVHLKGLTNLQNLGIGRTQITDAGLVHLKELTNLTSLSLPKQITDAGLRHLKGLTNLQDLTLAGIQITDAGLVHIEGLTKLERLNLDNTKITNAGLVHLKGLTNLQYLGLNGTQVTGAGLGHLAGMNLKGLAIPEQAQTDTGLKHYLAAIKPPTELHLNKHRMRPLLNWSITDSGLVHLKELTSLQVLNLEGTPITDAGLVHLQGLAKLEKLHLGKTKVTDAGIAELQKALPNCEIKK